MKKTLLLITCLFAFSVFVNAQTKPGPAEQKLIDALCEDLGKIDMSAIHNKQEATEAFMSSFASQSGLLMEVAQEHGVEVTDQPAMHKLGLGIGLNLMQQKCAPFIKLATLMAQNQVSEAESDQVIGGTFKRIDNKGFNYLVIADKKGSEVSFLWLRQFSGSEKFMNKTALLAGKKLVVTWQEIEVYLPLAKGYYKVKEITGVQFL